MKRLALVGMFLLAGGLFFYLLSKPVSLPIVPQSAASTSTAAYTKLESTPSEPVSEPKPAQEPQTAGKASIRIGSVNIPIEIAKTSAEVQKGLSGRLSLDQDKGMLFLFAKADIYSFWMPDMHFPLDMIWISSGKKVVGISANIPNDFDPANPKFYRPPSPTQYVLEVNAGFATRTGIKIGGVLLL